MQSRQSMTIAAVGTRTLCGGVTAPARAKAAEKCPNVLTGPERRFVFL
jgi:hypothetical protein